MKKKVNAYRVLVFFAAFLLFSDGLMRLLHPPYALISFSPEVLQKDGGAFFVLFFTWGELSLLLSLLGKWFSKEKECLFLRIFLGVVFLHASFTKLVDPIEFSLVLRNYEILRDPFIAVLAVFIPWIELLCGLCLLFKRLFQGALFLSTCMIVCFLGMVIFLWSQGIEKDCGCFGGQFMMGNAYLMGRNLLLLAIAGILFLLERKKQQKMHRL